MSIPRDEMVVALNLFTDRKMDTRGNWAKRLHETKQWYRKLAIELTVDQDWHRHWFGEISVENAELERENIALKEKLKQYEDLGADFVKTVTGLEKLQAEENRFVAIGIVCVAITVTTTTACLANGVNPVRELLRVFGL